MAYVCPNDPKSSDRKVSANSVYQDQIALEVAVCQIRVYTICDSVFIFRIYDIDCITVE